MGEIRTLLAIKSAELKNRLRQFRRGSKFKAAVIVAASALFWYGLYQFFRWGMLFFRYRIGEQYFDELAARMFHMFFLALTIMLVISNAIICYSSFFRSRETGFLLSKPIKPENIFFYKFFESLGFSSWALLFLATPLMVAYGDTFARGAWFYVASLFYFAAFMFLPAGVGALVAMFVTNFLPNLRRRLIWIAILAIVVLAVTVVAKVLEIRAKQPSDTYRLVMDVFEEVEFSQHPLLPSTWVTRGILSLAAEDFERAYFFMGVILANCAFLLALGYNLAHRWMEAGWFAAQGQRRTKKYPERGLIDWLFDTLLFFLNRDIRLIVIKDVKSFVRDPVQWSQFLVFFGLLAIYFLNLRQFAYDSRELFWKSLISQMNLLATALTLSTFASRFIFPQLSLEGRRFWIMGMIPIRRETVLFGKMAFAFVCSLLISEALIGLSSYMLRMPLVFALVHMVSLMGICLGLSGMAVGLGALYPNFREDNPSKIISGFGGTLNLVLNLLFVMTCVAIQAIPFVVYYARWSVAGSNFRLALVLSLAGVTAVSLIACFVPMALGLRAVRRMEI